MIVEFNAREYGYIIEGDQTNFHIVVEEWDIIGLDEYELDDYITECIKDYMLENFNC